MLRVLKSVLSPGAEAATAPPADNLDARRAEEKEFARLHDAAKSGVWYIVDIHWLRSWRQFVNGQSSPPGPISNGKLATRDEVHMRDTLRPIQDYRAINADLWEFLHERYGGGPILRRRNLDFYSAPVEDASIHRTISDTDRLMPDVQATHSFCHDPRDSKMDRFLASLSTPTQSASSSNNVGLAKICRTSSLRNVQLGKRGCRGGA